MKSPSVYARQSIRSGLAMAVTMAIALRMEFAEPAWAGFAVAMISLETSGQSLNKAALRMVGTLVAFVASLTFIGLFPQQRWAMMLALSLYIGFCTYMLAGKKRPYFWFVAAFVCLTIMVHGGAEPEHAFHFAVARVEETALGILVYSLIGMFVWPSNSRGDLESSSRALIDIQLRLYRAYRGLLVGRGRPEDSRPLRLQEIQCLSQLGQVLAGAETDTYEVWELRHTWRRFLGQSTVLLETLGRWRVSLPEVRPLELVRMLPGMDASLEELDRRLEQIERMLAGHNVDAPPQRVDLSLAESEVRALSHFERAAVALFLAQLRKLDEVSLTLFDSVQEIRGSGPIASKPPSGDAYPPALAFDIERFRLVVTVLATMWTGFLLWIWLDPPGHSKFTYLATMWAMVAILSHQSVPSLLPGFLLGIVAGGVAYVGVMPHLSGYLELGLMLFCATAGGFYLLSEPRRRGNRSIYAAMFLIFTFIDNQQTYSFSDYANNVVMILLSVALASAAAYFLGSPRPEKVFLRQLARFFRHAEILMSDLAPERHRRRGLAGRWKSAWVRNDLLELPEKLGSLVEQLDYRLLPGTTPEQVRALVTNLLSVTLRIKELQDARKQVRTSPRLEQVVADLRDWRLSAQQQFGLWAVDPSAALHPDTEMSERLHARLAVIEADLEAARSQDGEGSFHPDYEMLYRYLGGFRGLSEAAIGYAGVAGAVDWEPWREARF